MRRIGRQHSVHQRSQRRRKSGTLACYLGNPARAHFGHHFERRLAGKGRLAGEDFEQHAAERKNVRPAVNISAPARLLG